MLGVRPGEKNIKAWPVSKIKLSDALCHPKVERAFLDGLPKKEAARIAGSQDKLQRVLDEESVEDLYNEGKDDLYK
jgi:hypothetical protein